MTRKELRERPSPGAGDVVNTRQVLAAAITTAATSFSVTSMCNAPITQKSAGRELVLDKPGPCREGTAALSRGHGAGPRSSREQKLPEEQRRGRRGPASRRGGWDGRAAGDKQHPGGRPEPFSEGGPGHLEVPPPPFSPGCHTPRRRGLGSEHEPRPPGHGEAHQRLPRHHAPEDRNCQFYLRTSSVKSSELILLNPILKVFLTVTLNDDRLLGNCTRERAPGPRAPGDCPRRALPSGVRGRCRPENEGCEPVASKKLPVIPSETDRGRESRKTCLCRGKPGSVPAVWAGSGCRPARLPGERRPVCAIRTPQEPRFPRGRGMPRNDAWVNEPLKPPARL